MDEHGNVFLAVPGGVAVLSPDGTLLGLVYTSGLFASNVVIGGDGYLYVTAAETILRVRVLTKAAPPPPPHPSPPSVPR